MTVENAHPKQKMRLHTTTQWLFSPAGARLQDALTLTVPGKERDNLAQVTEAVEEYEIIDSLGEGAVCDVYSARSKALDKVVALKILKQELVSNKAAVKQFDKEVRAALELSHPNIASVYGCGHTANGVPFLVQELCEGRNLADVIREGGKFEPTRALKLFLQISESVAHAHGQAVIHRDLKPSNIVLSQVDQPNNIAAIDDGEQQAAPEKVEVARVIDFGMSSVLQSARSAVTDVTRTGEVFGTPSYMSPEQCLGNKVDERSDVYSFGCLMYETITGRPPFIGVNPVQVILKQLKEAPPKFELSNKTKDFLQLEKVILRCMEKEPARRYQNFDSLHSDLESCLKGKDITARNTTGGISPAKRMLASALDLAIISIPVAICGYIMEGSPIVVFLYPLFASIYHIFMESSPMQASFGKRLFGLKVVDMDGHTISRKKAFLRFFAKCLAPAMMAIESSVFSKSRKYGDFFRGMVARTRDLPTDRMLELQVIAGDQIYSAHPLRGGLFPSIVEQAYTVMKRLRFHIFRSQGIVGIAFWILVTGRNKSWLSLKGEIALLILAFGLTSLLVSSVYLYLMMIHKNRLLRNRKLSQDLSIHSWTGIFMRQLDGGKENQTDHT